MYQYKELKSITSNLNTWDWNYSCW